MPATKMFFRNSVPGWAIGLLPCQQAETPLACVVM
jgi:hypothetical protein